MKSYTIYLGVSPVVSSADTEVCYACFDAVKAIASKTGKTASLVWDETGEVVADYDPED